LKDFDKKPLTSDWHFHRGNVLY